MDSRAVAFGIGIAAIPFLLQFAIRAMPLPLIWGGVAFGGLMAIWGAFEDRIPVRIGPAVLFAFGVACIVGATTWHYGDSFPSGKSGARDEGSQMVTSSGGKGGNAKVSGNGLAAGGPGGSIANDAQGHGGDGGSAEVYGSGIAAGGAGGSVGSSVYWPHPAKNGYDAMMAAKGVSVSATMRRPGRGGAAAGYMEKLSIVNGLRATYFTQKHLSPKDYLDDIDAVPLDYLNKALADSGATWRVKIVDLNEYDFYIP